MRVLESKGTLWAICVLAAVLFLVTNLPWQLDDYDQAKQAFTSFEMVKEGHWLYQRTPHERIATKPPLVGWISAGVFEVTRSWDVAWRLPSLGAAIALSILLFRAGSVYGVVGGLMALSAFAFNLLTPRLASLVRTDMPLALVVFAIGWQIWRHVREQRDWNARDRLSIFALLTAAMLIKGPIVYAFLLPGIVLMCRRDGGRYSWSGWWPWLASLSIFITWVIAGSVLIPSFYDQVVMREFVGRFGETVHRPQPFYFYLPHLLHKFAPWSVLIIAMAIVDLRTRSPLDRLKQSTPSRSGAGTNDDDCLKQSSDGRPERKELEGRRIPAETWWLICWSLGGLLVMSLVPSKRVDRIFPIIPPLCLLVAAQLRPRFHRWVAVALLLSILSAGGYSGFKVVTGYRDHRDALAKFGASVRDEAASRHWRYEIVNSSDEGLLLYLQKPNFIRADAAVAQWNSGNLDALIAPVAQAPDLPGVIARKDERGGYVLITR